MWSRRLARYVELAQERLEQERILHQAAEYRKQLAEQEREGQERAEGTLRLYQSLVGESAPASVRLAGQLQAFWRLYLTPGTTSEQAERAYIERLEAEHDRLVVELQEFEAQLERQRQLTALRQEMPEMEVNFPPKEVEVERRLGIAFAICVGDNHPFWQVDSYSEASDALAKAALEAYLQRPIVEFLAEACHIWSLRELEAALLEYASRRLGTRLERSSLWDEEQLAEGEPAKPPHPD